MEEHESLAVQPPLWASAVTFHLAPSCSCAQLAGREHDFPMQDWAQHLLGATAGTQWNQDWSSEPGLGRPRPGLPGTVGQCHPETCAMKWTDPDTAACLEEQVAGLVASQEGRETLV